jgi:tetratricopeptide (TPR) repeat protein
VWHGLGDSYLHLGQLDVAEEALKQANLLDDENPDIWGSLSLLNLKKSNASPGQFTKARQCLTMAIKLGLKDQFLLTQIGDEFVRRFFLVEGGPHIQKFSVEEASMCYTQAEDGSIP